jgi:hypothetical protein
VQVYTTLAFKIPHAKIIGSLDMPVLNLSRLEDTVLWKKLNEGYKDEDEQYAKQLANSLLTVCKEAYDRMKGFASSHPQYTLHDEVHLLRVTELMAKVLGDKVLSILNPIEVALLILAAHFHDQGMVLDSADMESIIQDQNYLLFQQTWSVEHPNLREIQSELNEPNRTADDCTRLRQIEQELLAARNTDYIRTTHGERSARFVLSRYKEDKRLNIAEVNISDLIAKLSLSHVRPAIDLNEVNGFNYDEAIGTYTVNMVFLGVILRLADILDFDRDRTPDSLYRSIYFTSAISLQEWEKHRGVTGWTIDSSLIRFTAEFESPEYERAARKFMDWIDAELAACHSVVSKFPRGFEEYELNLPLIVDRDRIKPRNGAYIYHDLEFSLSRDEIVKLLMTNKLYGNSGLCIRELLQNSFDAIRLRKAIMSRDSDALWSAGEVNFDHYLNEDGYEIIKCQDNGIGMDEYIITKFLTNVGRSYYKSPEFEQERQSLRQSGVDFDPIGQFGIGFMSCFMLGDKVTIRTKKDYGKGIGYGPNLQVEINGLGGIIVIKKLATDIPVGTTIEIQCPKFKGILDYFSTKVQVVDTLLAITIAAEFPVKATCRIPANEKECLIEPIIADIATPEQRNNIIEIITPSYEFNNLSDLLQGTLKISFIKIGNSITTENSEIKLVPAPALGNVEGDRNGLYPKIVLVKSNQEFSRSSTSRISFDGIYVCGNAWWNGINPGSKHKAKGLTEYINPADTSFATFTLNVKGILKASLTPSRVPNLSSTLYNNLPNDWLRLVSYVETAVAKIHEMLVAQEFGIIEPLNYWKYIAFNRVNTSCFNMLSIWSVFAFPFSDSDGSVIWIPLKELGQLSMTQDGFYGEYIFDINSGKICIWNDGYLWADPRKPIYSKVIAKTLLAFCNLDYIDGQHILSVVRPNNPNELVGSKTVANSDQNIQIIPYIGSLYGCLTSFASLHTVNANHPLIKLAIQIIDKQVRNAIEDFAIEILFIAQNNFSSAEQLISSFEQNKVWAKRLGLMYKLVKWEGYPTDVKPPYTIQLLNGEFTELTDKLFIKWSSLPI